MKKSNFAVIVGNRGFFPDKLARQGRKDILAILKKYGYDAVVLSEQDTKYGSVETFADAKKCAALFARNKDHIDGIIVTLPNFGDEKAVAETIKRADLDVPILIHAEPDSADKMSVKDRRDSFCGKISVCSNLFQAAIPYSLTRSHTSKVNSAEFKQDLESFAAVCRIVNGLKDVRLGAIGARPGAFNTVRYSEKILEQAGIAIETIDLSDITGRALKCPDNDKTVQAKLQALKSYIPTNAIAPEPLLRMAKFGAVVDQWVAELDLNGTAIQCWTSLEEFFGITPCSLMSMMSENLLPSACEVDVTGLLAMYILQLAGGTPSALLDWNNNFAKDKCMLFHCSNLPKSFLKAGKMGFHDIIGDTVGRENTPGTVLGTISPGPATFCRTTTDDTLGLIRAYVGDGEFTNDKVDSFGGYGVIKIPNLDDLMRHICQMGYEHHVAVSLTRNTDAIVEALDNYLGWEVYHHI